MVLNDALADQQEAVAQILEVDRLARALQEVAQADEFYVADVLRRALIVGVLMLSFHHAFSRLHRAGPMLYRHLAASVERDRWETIERS